MKMPAPTSYYFPSFLLVLINLPPVLSCLVARGYLVIVAAVGIWAAARVKRYANATVSRD